MVEGLADQITQNIEAPTIGIGASLACDGQILVLEDMLGMNTWTPKFVKTHAQLGPIFEAAVAENAEEVKIWKFPSAQHVYGKGW